MKPLLAISTLFLAASAVFLQTETMKTTAQPLWQKVDQLCGQLELAEPTNKTIMVNGKHEERSDVTYVNDAEVFLYRGTLSDKECCGSGLPLGRTRSKRFGAFELVGFRHGLYWLQVKKGKLKGEIPLLVTHDFNARNATLPKSDAAL